ncbi:hypothetical protein AGLY_012260 [Aphis glycines]|uniref:Uncharacterized protein n=1 Tax=Aphis glycines TaxID=307491 RepID=A0A6G0TA73_APHGL|nr:hypothetical protein AGLY_012260 [Aphis glycines]
MQVKGEVATKNTAFKLADVEKLVHETIDSVTTENWEKCVRHAEKLQDIDFEKEVAPKQRTTQSSTSRRNVNYQVLFEKISLSAKKFPSNIREDLRIVDEEIESEMKTENYVSIGHKKENLKRAKHKNKYLVIFFNKLPEFPSHYSRKSTRKLYLQKDITSISHLNNVYCVACTNDNEEPLSRKKFVDLYNDQSLNIYAKERSM